MSPSYDFACEECGTKKEIMMSFKEHDEKKNNLTCDCGCVMVQEVSSPKFNLAGSGWYRDSYGATFNEAEHNNEIRKYDSYRNGQDKIERHIQNEIG